MEKDMRGWISERRGMGRWDLTLEVSDIGDQILGVGLWLRLWRPALTLPSPRRRGGSGPYPGLYLA
jgi:hypothetical protein